MEAGLLASGFFMLFFAILWLASAVFTSNVASEKGYNGVGWFFAGFFFGFVALVAAAGLPDRATHKCAD